MSGSDFCQERYLSWYIPRVRRHDGAINLHSSGMAMLPPVTGEVSADDPMDSFRQFEAALGKWLGHPADELVYTSGATGGTLLALLALTPPGAQVLAEAPMYEPMLRQAQRLGPVRRLIRRSADGWQLPLDAARTALSEGARLVMVTEPHNPSGVFAPREQVLELVDMAAHYGAFVLINEVYRGFSDRPTYHGAADNVVVVSSLSKLLGAYWGRLGWLGATPSLAEQLRMAHVNMGIPSVPSAAAGVAVLRDAATLQAAAARCAAAGVDIVDAWVARTPGLSWQRPQGPGYGTVALPPGFADVALAERLHDQYGVLPIPGTLFEAPGTLRIAWLQSGNHLGEGLRRVTEGLTAGL